MPKWIVRTRATVDKIYYVEANNEKEAEAKSCDMQPDHEEDVNEETMSIVVDRATIGHG